jgi:hypothetical protein
MSSKDIGENKGELYANHEDDSENEDHFEDWIEKHSHRIGKLTIRPFPMGVGLRESRTLFEEISFWWWCLTDVFSISANIGLSGINIGLWILGTGFSVKLDLPNFAIHLPFLSKLNLDWHTFAHLNHHKGWELQTWYAENWSVGLSISSNMHTDHFGIFVELDLLFVHIEFSLYDGRHWDGEHNQPDEWLEEKGCWKSDCK